MLPKIPRKITEIELDKVNPNKIFRAQRKKFKAFQQMDLALGKREIKFLGKAGKFSGKVWSTTERILKTLHSRNTR